MAVKVIETQARISAKDNTGGTFDLVAQKMRHLEQAALSVNRRMDSVARGMSSTTWRRQAEFQAGIVQKMGMAGAVARGAGGRLAGMREKISDFAAYALPGAAGMAAGIGGAAVGGLAVGGAATYGLRQAISFDKAMADVRKKVNIDAGKSIDDVETMINKTARSIGMAREEVAQLAAQAGQSGVAFKDLGEFMQIAAKASSAWDVPAKEAAQTMAEIRAQTGWTNKELETYADKINFLGDISAAAEKDISSMWARTSSGAKEAGVSYDDAMVALTALRSVGMQEDVATRAFGQFSSRLRTASSQPKAAQAAIKGLGFTAKGLEKGMQTDAMGTMIKFLDALGKSKDAVKYAVGFGGKEWWDEFLRFKSALPEMIRLHRELSSGKAAGSLNQALKIDQATTDNHLKRFKALTSEIGDRMTRFVLPPINELLDTEMKRYDNGTFGSYWNPISAASNIFNGNGEAASSVFARMRGMRPTGRDIATSMGFAPVGGSFQSSFNGTKGTGWAGGDAAGSVAPGALAFGLGGNGVGDLKALQVAPNNPAALARASVAESATALRAAPPPPVKLEGAANIDLKVVVEAAADFLAKVEQTIAARGALRSDTGVSMAP